MFESCSKLIFLNLYSFKFNSPKSKNFAFDKVSSTTKYCIIDISTKDYILGSSINSDCSDICFKENIIVDMINEQCIEACSLEEYKFKFENKCYIECPKDTFAIYCEDEECESNKRECYDYTIQGYYLNITNKFYQKCFDTCKFCNGEGNEEFNNCIECNSGYYFLNYTESQINCYEKCEYYYYFDEYNKYQCTELCPSNFNKLIINKNKCIDECENDDIYKYEYINFCYSSCPNNTIAYENSYICNDNNNDKNYYNDTFIYSCVEEIVFKNKIKNSTNDSTVEIQDQILIKIQEILNNGFVSFKFENGKDIEISIEEFTYTITTTSNQNNNKDKNKSTINLGECEKKLKDNYNISYNDSLYILKIDAMVDNILKVEYEVYYPFSANNLTRLNLSMCKNLKINILIPLEISIDDIDKYNISSPLYNDICYTLTSESGTDKPLIDRQNEYKKSNISVCEEDCVFSDYDNLNKKAICSCFTKLKLPLISDIKVDKKKLFSNFKNIKNVGNFKMVKCFHLLFDIKNIFRNSSNYIVVILFVLLLINIFLFICYYNRKIKNYIYLSPKNNITTNIVKHKKRKRKIEKDNQNKEKQIMFGPYINLSIKNNIINNNIINKNKNHIEKSERLNIDNIKTKKINKSNKNKVKCLQKKNYKSHKNKNVKISKIFADNIDNELNSLDYEEAKKRDHRTFFQYYLSLLRTKHILIFTFCQLRDYNAQSIKIYIFFYTFAINYLVSAMFYSDDTMHKIYIDDGSFDFTYQLPQMLYSFIISTVLGTALDILGLYEDDIISFVHDKNNNLDIKRKLLFKIRCKMIFFFIFTFILLGCFWIYLGCFCAIYKNTQIHLLLDVSLSFGLSFISPLYVYILPTIFRIISLKKETNRQLLFKLSKLLEML